MVGYNYYKQIRIPVDPAIIMLFLALCTLAKRNLQLVHIHKHKHMPAHTPSIHPIATELHSTTRVRRCWPIRLVYTDVGGMAGWARPLKKVN